MAQREFRDYNEIVAAAKSAPAGTLIAILTVGVSASGKSTAAENFFLESRSFPFINHYVHLERDRLRIQYLEEKNVAFTWDTWKRRGDEKEITRRMNDGIARCSEMRMNIIISDTNLNPKFRGNLIADLERRGYEVWLWYFDISYHEAVRRDLLRDNPVGAWVIGKQFDMLRKQNHTRTHQCPSKSFLNVYDNLRLNRATFIVDIDGTIATMNGRSPYDWDKVGTDAVNVPVATIVTALACEGFSIIFLSGRDGSCRDLTEEWISEVFGGFDNNKTPLFMRAPGDMRADVVIKRELFDEHIDGKYNVVACIDDRPKVTTMWRDMGIPVIQVGDPYIDF